MVLITGLPKLLEKQNRLPNSRCKCSFIGRNHSVIYLNHCALEGRFINQWLSPAAPVEMASMRSIIVLHSLRTGMTCLNLKCALLDRMVEEV